MISDDELRTVYEQAFNRRMVAVDGISSRCHADGIRAVAAYAARRQREVDCQHVLSAIKGYDGTQEYIDAQRAAPLVTDADNG